MPGEDDNPFPHNLATKGLHNNLNTPLQSTKVLTRDYALLKHLTCKVPLKVGGEPDQVLGEDST